MCWFIYVDTCLYIVSHLLCLLWLLWFAMVLQLLAILHKLTVQVVSANVLRLKGGEIVSTCGTHLGHDLPDGPPARARYCINLLCVAGFGGNGSAQPSALIPSPKELGAATASSRRSLGLGPLGLFAVLTLFFRSIEG